jgi:hypothetical protein
VLVSLLALATTATLAVVQQTVTSSSAVVVRVDLHLGFGGGTGEGAGRGLLVGGNLDVEWDSLFGEAIVVGMTPFGEGHTYLGIGAGLRARPAEFVSLDAVVEAGAHIASGIGGGLFVTSRGDNTATLAYVGGGATLAFVLHPSVGPHLVLGFGLRVRSDASTETVRPTLGDARPAPRVVGGGQSVIGALVVGTEIQAP